MSSRSAITGLAAFSQPSPLSILIPRSQAGYCRTLSSTLVGGPLNSSITSFAVVLPVLLTAWVSGSFHTSSPVLRRMALSALPWLLVVRSASAKGTRRTFPACACSPIFDPGGNVTFEIVHWSDVKRLTPEGQSALLAESHGTRTAHASVQAFWFVVGCINSMVRLRNGVVPLLLTA